MNNEPMLAIAARIGPSCSRFALFGASSSPTLTMPAVYTAYDPAQRRKGDGPPVAVPGVYDSLALDCDRFAAARSGLDSLAERSSVSATLVDSERATRAK